MSLGPQGGRGLLVTMWRLALARQQLLLVAVAMVLLDASALLAVIGALGRADTFASCRERDLRRAADARRRSRPGVRRQRRVCGGRRSVRGRAPVAALLAARGLHPRACRQGRPAAAHVDVGRAAGAARRAHRDTAGVRDRRAGEGRPGRARRSAPADRARLHALRRLRDRGRRPQPVRRRSAPACTCCCAIRPPRSA